MKVPIKPSETSRKPLYGEVKPSPVLKVAETPAPVKTAPVSAADSSPAASSIDHTLIVPGTKVMHQKFGIGQIISRKDIGLDGNYEIRVVFAKGGEKLLQGPLVFDKKILMLPEE